MVCARICLRFSLISKSLFLRMISIRNACPLLKDHQVQASCIVVILICVVLFFNTAQFFHENYKSFACCFATFYLCACLLDQVLLILKKLDIGIFRKILLWKYNSFGYILNFICFIVICLTYSECNRKYFLGSLLLSVIYTILKQNHGYSDADVNSCQKWEDSIGAYWAHGAYIAFYEIVLKDLTDRISQYEKENSGKFHVKKLVIIIPLSCDVRKTLTEKDEKMELLGYLQLVVDDQGANMNRKYKNSVYRISDYDESIYFAVENPSCLHTIWYLKDNILKDVWQYHRDCFIKQLRLLVRESPCIVLEYNDCCESPEPLHRFLISALSRKDENSIISFE